MFNQRLYTVSTTMEFPSVRPQLGKFELIGDSLMVRFAIHSRLVPSEIRVAKRLGLCISGITVQALLKRVQRDGVEGDCVLVLVGTNDIVKSVPLTKPRKYLSSVRGHFEHLKKLLKAKTKQVVFCTVPYIPRLQARFPGYIQRVERLNRMLLSWASEGRMCILPLHEVMSVGCGLPDPFLFEKTFKVTRGRSARPDGVHLNAAGNSVLLYFLECVFQDEIVDKV